MNNTAHTVIAHTPHGNTDQRNRHNHAPGDLKPAMSKLDLVGSSASGAPFHFGTGVNQVFFRGKIVATNAIGQAGKERSSFVWQAANNLAFSI